MPQKHRQHSILHILRAPLGGAFRHVADLIRNQHESGLATGLICDDASYGAASMDQLANLETFCALGVWRMPIPRIPGIRDVVTLRQILKRWRANPPAVLHGHGAKGAAYARIAAPWIGSAAVCTPHGGALHYSPRTPNGAVYLSMERALKHRTDGMIFESGYAMRQYVEKVGKITFPYRVIYNGLYDDEFRPVEPSETQYDFLFIGEFREFKGIFVLLEAAKLLQADGRNFSMLMAGSGPDKDKLRTEIERMGLEDTVTVSSPMYPARAAFAQARCVVTPSLNESMPYIVLEVIAACRPLITTAVGGIPEIFGNMRERLIPAGDVGALAARMMAFLDSPEQDTRAAAELQRAARGHLTVSQMEQQISEFYESLTGAARHSAVSEETAS